jgi:hypothetical protein
MNWIASLVEVDVHGEDAAFAADSGDVLRLPLALFVLVA